MYNISEVVKKNLPSLVILAFLAALLMLNILQFAGSHDMSFGNMKDYSNELRSKGLYEQAIESYKEYLKKTYTSKKIRGNTHYFIAEIYRDNLKDLDKALAHYIKIKYIYPDSPLMNNINQKIVECLENSGRSRAAQLALEESTALNKSGKKSGSSVILAKIDNDMITLADFNDWHDNLPDKIKKEFSGPRKRKELLRQYVSQELMYRMGMRKGLKNDPEVIKKSFEIKKNLIVQKLMQDEMGRIKITQKDVELYYKANRDKYKKPLNQVLQLVQQDFMQEKMQEKSQELISRMVKANSVQIFEANLR